MKGSATAEYVLSTVLTDTGSHPERILTSSTVENRSGLGRNKAAELVSNRARDSHVAKSYQDAAKLCELALYLLPTDATQVVRGELHYRLARALIEIPSFSSAREHLSQADTLLPVDHKEKADVQKWLHQCRFGPVREGSEKSIPRTAQDHNKQQNRTRRVDMETSAGYSYPRSA